MEKKTEDIASLDQWETEKYRTICYPSMIRSVDETRRIEKKPICMGFVDIEKICDNMSWKVILVTNKEIRIERKTSHDSSWNE